MPMCMLPHVVVPDLCCNAEIVPEQMHVLLIYQRIAL